MSSRERPIHGIHAADPFSGGSGSGDRVILLIVAKNDTFDRLFASAELSCRFRVYAPEEEELFGTYAMEPLYDTKNNPDLHKLLTAAIRKNPSGNTSVASFASLSWIAAVVIAIMILLAVIILAVCVVMRNKGRTYLLYQRPHFHFNLCSWSSSCGELDPLEVCSYCVYLLSVSANLSMKI
ncbi:unnamed protein product [Dibothriocephalus latus]|uniref:Uncharacterized protein n=1 Tax=Dibothriocephalus latus TaxID=60516 RepID=A0A3P7LB57_DIBLA|nr:unnamed protein product [Dibothriocephalus latus]